MLRQRHELKLECPLTPAFGALLRVVARGRWGVAAAEAGTFEPRAGLAYAQQRGTVFRFGKVLECRRPVMLTLAETLRDSPCCVQLRLQWRLEPGDSGARVLLEARFRLNGAATLRRAHWRNNIAAHCERMLAALKRDAVDLGASQSMYTRDNGAALAVPQRNAESDR